jgi:penicillin-binding protein 1C
MIACLRPRVWTLVATAMVFAAFDVAAAAPLPSFADVKSGYGTSEALLLDRHGAPLSEVRIDPRVRQLDWIRLADVSPAVAATLVAAEDKRFFEHGGVDWSGLAGAAWDSVWRTLDGRGARGGSTLTMQLAGMLDPALTLSGNARTFAQKWDQAQAARALERTWTKPQILEAYLNLASYRGELKGLDAAANGLFGKAPAGLDAREAAILVALLRGPNAPAALVAQRACAVTALSAPEIACEEVRAITTVALAGAYRLRARWNLAPHLAAKLLRSAGERKPTTLDAGLQRYAIDTLRQHLSELAERGVGDGAIVVLDNATGEVLAYVGSGGELSSAAQVDGAAAPRQAGSTLKPFLYALAFDSRLLTAASLVDDSPVAIATERGMYVPQNYDRQFRGMVSARTALGSSLNVPAVRTLGLVGVDRFHGALRQLGFDTLIEPDEYYGASLALGGADVNLLALANAYRALANGGEYGQPRWVPASATDRTQPRRVFGRQASFVVTDILADRGARATSFGLENPLATRVWSAAKTGTSKDMRDNWCVGFTSRYTVGVWVGNFSGAPMHDVSGVTGAAPIWRDLIHRLHATEPSVKPPPPPGLIEQRVAFEPEIETERDEWFLTGTQSRLVALSAGADASAAVTPRIRYPAPETIIALDPDIAERHQRVVFQASPALPGMRWRIGDTVLADAHGRAAWSPLPGKYTLFLENEAGQALSSVPFEVRGNIAR